jgi:hypothetical protein
MDDELLRRFQAMEAELAQLRKEKAQAWTSEDPVTTSSSDNSALLPTIPTEIEPAEAPLSPSPSASSSARNSLQIGCTVCDLDLSDDFSDLRAHPTLNVALCCDCFDEIVAGDAIAPKARLPSSSSPSAALSTLITADLAKQHGAGLDVGANKTEKQLKSEANVRQGNAAVELLLSAQGALEPERFTVCVISKGRPDNVPLINSLFAGSAQLPTWVVGAGESASYLSQGAAAVLEGGGLCASRNAALALARSSNTFCVQLSDDVSEIRLLVQPQGVVGQWERPVDLSAANALAKQASKHAVSPLTAARFLELEMRSQAAGPTTAALPTALSSSASSAGAGAGASTGASAVIIGQQQGQAGLGGCCAKLGGAYPTANEGQAMGSSPVSTDLFCVGDFLVVDPTSTPRFDEQLSLKEGG